MTVETSPTYVDAAAQRVTADNAIEYAYRDLEARHGFLFQHHSRFAADVHAFLEETD